MGEFSLDLRLKADCLSIAELKLCQLLLMNDRRWPWLILVPRINDAVEIHHLEAFDQAMLQQETARIAEILAEVSGCEKINTGALGNIVRQLHVHVIGRSRGDENWPGPVWGFGERQHYQPGACDELIIAINNRLA